MRSTSQTTANSTASSIQTPEPILPPPPTPISRDTTPNTTKESERNSLDLGDIPNAAADFEADCGFDEFEAEDCGFDDRSAHCLYGSVSSFP
jgi:hypothetical protein